MTELLRFSFAFLALAKRTAQIMPPREHADCRPLIFHTVIHRSVVRMPMKDSHGVPGIPKERNGYHADEGGW